MNGIEHQLPLMVATIDQQLEQHAQNIERVQRDAVFEIGRELAEAQALFRYDKSEGGFTGWLEKRLPQFSERTAYRALDAYKNVDPAMFAKLAGIRNPSALAEIAKAEPDLQAQIAERVEAGEIFTAAAVKQLRTEAATEALAQYQKEAEEIRGQLAAMRRMVTQRENDAVGLETKVEDLAAALKDREDKIAKLEKAAPAAPAPAAAAPAPAPAAPVVQPTAIPDDFSEVWSALVTLTHQPSAAQVVRTFPVASRSALVEECADAIRFLESVVEQATQ
jgi:DNA repair exonuclease SbcCD ATPase subunit